MLIEEILFERSRASLYHFTNLPSAYKILTSNVMKFGNKHEDRIPNSISFTRNPNLKGYGLAVIRFELDQDKLKTRHKIIPHKWNYLYSIGNEFEERIKGDINNINDYIIELTWPNYQYTFNELRNTTNKLFNPDSDIIKMMNYIINHPKFNKQSGAIEMYIDFINDIEKGNINVN